MSAGKGSAPRHDLKAFGKGYDAIRWGVKIQASVVKTPAPAVKYPASVVKTRASVVKQ